MNRATFDWDHFRKCEVIAGAVGFGAPIAWVILNILFQILGVIGQLVTLIVAGIGLYVLVFPWTLIFNETWTTDHWPIFVFVDAILVGVVWGGVTARNRHLLPPPPAYARDNYPFG